jgi:hypothetical protein
MAMVIPGRRKPLMVDLISGKAEIPGNAPTVFRATRD